MKYRRNFLTSLLITVLLWIVISVIVFFVSPDTFWEPPLFFVTFFTATLFTVSLLTNRMIGLITSILVTLILLLRYFGFRF